MYLRTVETTQTLQVDIGLIGLQLPRSDHRRDSHLFQPDAEMSPRGNHSLARMVVSQKTGRRDGDPAALEFSGDLPVDERATRLPALPSGNAVRVLNQWLAVDVIRIALAGADMSAAPDHDPVTMSFFQRRNVKCLLDQQHLVFPESPWSRAAAAEWE